MSGQQPSLGFTNGAPGNDFLHKGEFAQVFTNTLVADGQVDISAYKLTASAVAASATYNATQILGGVIYGAPAAAQTFTFPTVTVLVAGMSNPKNGDFVPLKIVNTGANAATLAGVAGGANAFADRTATTALAANSSRDLLLHITDITGAAAPSGYIYG